MQTTGQDQATHNIQGLKALRELVDIVQWQSGPKLDTIQTEIQNCLLKIDDLRKQLPRARENAILRCLNFSQISWRYEEVPLAFQQTYQWIFQNSSEESAWDDFTGHLIDKDVTAPYWVNGKAGSGKSTLMKFIVNDARTLQALTSRAGNEQLFGANFSFGT